MTNTDSREDELRVKWAQDWGFSGISTFGQLPFVRCLTQTREAFDIGVLGLPFDTATTYRPGARLGPRAIRAASGRHMISRGFNPSIGNNPYTSWAKILDCGDIPVTPLDNAVAVRQMTEGLKELLQRKPASERLAHPRLALLGGDHLIALPALRALHDTYGEPITLLHFDSHLDTLDPSVYPQAWNSQVSDVNHGTVFYHAAKEGLLANSSVHAGINTRLSGSSWGDYQADDDMGFVRIPASDVDEIGTRGVIDKIRAAIKPGALVYLSIDIDVLDPSFAPGTGAPEPGGWSTRELLTILRGCSDFDIVAADVVEVAPAYDTPGGDTALVAAALIYEIMAGIVEYHSHAKAAVMDDAPIKSEL
ncbi:Arginase/deacetylase [Colletotrichum caudatum]|nr:Arginase/deacetylase [Colletotrichum caudatum]